MERIARVRQLAFKGMTVRRPAVVESRPIYIAGESVRKKAVPMPAPGPALHEEDIWQMPTVAKVARDLVESELQASAPVSAPTEKIIRSSTGTTIVVRKADVPPQPSQVVAVNGGTYRDPVRELMEEDSSPSFIPNLSTLSVGASDVRPLWLNGQIEMTGGLAFVGPETHLVVKRVMDGQTYERGRIWVTEGKFEIHVKKAIGFLVAELQTRDGRVLGRGEVNLLHLGKVPAKASRIDDIRIALAPTAENASFRTVSAYSHGDQMMPIREARVEIQAYMDAQAVNDEGFVGETTLDRDSTFVVRARAKKHWSSLVVGQAGQPQDIRLFSNSLVDALIELVLRGTDRKEAYHQGVVWGQIRQADGFVAGAQVEMAGDYKPVYFNEAYLPDPGMTATGRNGLFAFLRVKQGIQAVRVKTKDRVYPAQIFPTEDKHVAYIDFELRDKVVSQFKVIDMLDMTRPVSARIRLVGTDEVLNLNGDDYVEYAVPSRTFMVEADAGPEFELSRTTMTGAPHLVHLPVVRKDWLYQLYSGKNIVPAPGRGTVVGFIDDQDFEIEMTGYAPHEEMHVVYFDREGRPLEGRMGVAGGGLRDF
ncbi:MAG: hypothetical protein HC902_01570 [Calothrix sp. SM1_5_4]|nr:hypothetical protein [Calothrix sp. SM1_5_4]